MPPEKLRRRFFEIKEGMAKFIFVSGGVISGVGKGIITASLGKILSEYGYKTTLIKADPYFNYDAGTLRPTEHGEVWVTDDGGEIDQDLGTYERFLNQDISKKNSLTSGQVYKSIIDRERAGAYLGQTVQFIPHIPQEIIDRVKYAAHGYDVAIIEIGGSVGDYENIPFLFAAKSLEREIGFDNVAHVLVSFLPIPKHIGEMKTRPTRRAIRLLRREGIFPDFIVCRAEREVDEKRKKKIDIVVHISTENIVSAPNLETIYEVPLNLHGQKLGKKILKRLKLEARKEADFSQWWRLVDRIKKPQSKIKVAICGKYLKSGDYDLSDSYLSVQEALIHAGAQLDVGIDIEWIPAKDFESGSEKIKEIQNFDGVIVPGGFGKMGVEGKIKVIEFVRKNNIPYLGLCYGMQLACIEFARNMCGMDGANSTEVNETTPFPIVDFLPEQACAIQKDGYGGTMRLGGYPAMLNAGSKVLQLYQETERLEKEKNILARMVSEHDDRITQPVLQAIKDGKYVVVERHRHRYEINPEFITQLEKAGLFFSGSYVRKDGTTLMEFLELLDHKFFVATQAHPEFKSRLGNPSPLFYGFVRACLK